MRNWVLPEYVDDILPAEAERIEALRRELLDHFRGRGYRLVQPPLIEHLESLLTGTGRDLELQTFKLVDPLSGRLLGVRADITPQVARIDAHLLNEPGVTRLCYAGSVLRTVAHGVAQSREVLQIGAELYGDPEIGADKEVLDLLLSSLEAVSVRGLHLDLGHVGVYRALAGAAGIAGSDADTELFDAMRGKDRAAVAEITARFPAAWRDAFVALPSLYGPADEVLSAARERLPDTPLIAGALSALATLAATARDSVRALDIDLADLRGYHYQNGASFSVFTEGEPNAIGRGERYDGIGKAFGRARPATGFTLDLRQLARLGQTG
ncbi:MAG TPA: ATP phosphoribosyltransferase regulatory subunit [Casimicrobiaceae bacterium]|jgi:ATP phosphoribosyltransferase regulatory subunit|nr:ATP phosphoribosyltransferase regulatory subunit [Casimicrobiaceae bacterium]